MGQSLRAARRKTSSRKSAPAAAEGMKIAAKSDTRVAVEATAVLAPNVRAALRSEMLFDGWWDVQLTIPAVPGASLDRLTLTIPLWQAADTMYVQRGDDGGAGQNKIDTIPTGRINVIRDQAIRDLLAREGLPPPLELQIAIEDLQSEFVDAEPLVTGIRACLETQRGCFDALISHDTLASLAARILMETGCRIPGDVSVMGAGNSILAIYGLLPLTSISTADDQAGALAFGLLMDRMKQKRANLPFRRIVSPSNLIVRSSTIRT